ncbi:MAG TPA: zinc metalloprotease HtpX [Thermomicrobiaceae bacterium]|nr:zinc metalloprotease HtpX [Thermomicrobiaceae bacterium]
MVAPVGRMARWGRDRGLAFRMFIVMALLSLVYLAFMAVLVYVGFDWIPILVIAGILAVVQYYGSSWLALRSMGAHEVSAEQAPELHAIIERLSQVANIPKPRVAISNTDVPNAFATGRNPKNAVVAVTTGLMQRLDTPEIEAVLAHELSHVRNRDVMVMTLANFFAVVAQLLTRSFMWGGFGGYGRRDRDNGGSIALVYLASILVWVISFFLIRAISRYREYAADRGSAILTGAPTNLMSALVKISGVMQRIPERDLREVQTMNAFFIIPALKGDAMSELFSTHPSLENRLARLRTLSREMEGL